MPELPEVETLCRQLKKRICGKKILNTEIFDSKLAGIKNMRGRSVVAVERRGKTIAIDLDDGNSIIIHLRMTGRLLWQKISTMPEYSRWKMTFADGHIFLVDPRRFATVRILGEKESDAGREIFGNFELTRFIKLHGDRKTKIKTLIMNQNVVNGIGNIYACEILYRAGIHPERTSSSLTAAQWRKIFYQAKNVLKKAIAKRGTSISDWRDLYGRKGENQHTLKVYGKEGKPCSVCGGTICRIKLSGRGTYLCPDCQK
ncbi:MAG: DNA-formamidopyrimidine glycosylase [Deltaproteobacteria bacterium RBG_19FT_COMBO_43_11]|nr:MAG: DNA-formamidopyrimidine glycosylase [Deltaproteobacteria bacterium RBG_19FT_COMBO_43_11]